jgi:S-adenosylmethionine synthetase
MVASQQRGDSPNPSRLKDDLIENVVEPVFAEESLRPDSNTRLIINPGGPVPIGGPALHSGMTGRKSAVDMYGEYARTSSSALSGKDPMRIDRVANYAARCAAKNVVAARLAHECEIQLTYAVGQPGPVSIYVETFGTGCLSNAEIATRVKRHFDFRLASIIRELHLRDLAMSSHDGTYEKLAVFGHVGREDLRVPWETTEKIDLLR